MKPPCLDKHIQNSTVLIWRKQINITIDNTPQVITNEYLWGGSFSIFSHSFTDQNWPPKTSQDHQIKFHILFSQAKKTARPKGFFPNGWRSPPTRDQPRLGVWHSDSHQTSTWKRCEISVGWENLFVNWTTYGPKYSSTWMFKFFLYWEIFPAIKTIHLQRCFCLVVLAMKCPDPVLISWIC